MSRRFVNGRAIRPPRIGWLTGTAVLILLGAFGCGGTRVAPSAAAPGSAAAPLSTAEAGTTAVARFEKLSEYSLFEGAPALQLPAAGVIPYDLNSALFSDYADKLRFIKLPRGTKVTYHPDRVFEFPVGTVIAKTFAFPVDARDPSRGRRLIETRILKREPDGWTGLPYIWNKNQTEAILDVAGDTVDVSWIHTDGRPRTDNYIIPNANQCKGCHKANDIMRPIGPKARNLNRDFVYHDGTENQLTHWTNIGALDGAPAPLRRLASPCGTTRRAARSMNVPVPGSKSTVPIATVPRGPLAIQGSTCPSCSAIRLRLASKSRPSPPVLGPEASPTTSCRESPINQSWFIGSPRHIRA